MAEPPSEGEAIEGFLDDMTLKIDDLQAALGAWHGLRRFLEFTDTEGHYTEQVNKVGDGLLQLVTGILSQENPTEPIYILAPSDGWPADASLAFAQLSSGANASKPKPHAPDLIGLPNDEPPAVAAGTNGEGDEVKKN